MPQGYSVYRIIRNTPLSKYFFYALVFLLPFGTGQIYFTDSSFFYNYHIFYNSFWLYLTDLIFCGLILSWLWESWPFSKVLHRLSTAIRENTIYQFLGVFWLISLVSVSVSREINLSLYGLWKISEYLLIFIYIREKVDISREIHRIFWLILAISCFEAVLAINQYLLQTSFGLSWAGEPFLRQRLKGLAEFVTAASGIAPEAGISRETVMLRGYGTFPHPNVLGGFLLLGLMANIGLFMRKGLIVSRETVLALSLIVITMGLVVSFSRNAWVATVIALIIYLVFAVSREIKRKIALLGLVLAIALAVNLLMFGSEIKDRISSPLPSPPHQGEGKTPNYSSPPSVGGEVGDSDESLQIRKRFSSISREMIQNRPGFGVGLRNFVVRMDEYNRGDRLLPYLHQPVHNIYLLIASEIGIAGLIIFLGIIFYIVRPGSSPIPDRTLPGRHVLLAIFAGFLFIGLFDHYLFTVQQGGLMFWITAGLLTAETTGLQ